MREKSRLTDALLLTCTLEKRKTKEKATKAFYFGKNIKHYVLSRISWLS